MADTAFDTLPINFKKINVTTIVTTAIILIAVIWLISWISRDVLIDDQGVELGIITKKFGWNNKTQKTNQTK